MIGNIDIDNNKDEFKVLIVDDTPQNIQLLANILSTESYQVGFAQNGEDALKIATSSHFHIILLDVMMPGIDGFEVCKQLKADEKTRDIPVIFLTAKTDQDSIVKGFELGGADYISKPFNQSELLVRVKTHIQSNAYKQKLIQTNNQLKEEIENRQEAELKLSIVASETDNGVMIFDENGRLEWQNFAIMNLYHDTEILNRLLNANHIIDISGNPKISNIFRNCEKNLRSEIFETSYKLDKGKIKWIQTTLTPIINGDGGIDKYVAIDADISNIKTAELEIKEKNKKIIDSIHYAYRIQNAILPPIKKINNYFPESFILFKPKDIVSGDFFWINEDNDKVFVAAVDCTGHGVPGAFMSLIGHNILNKAIHQQNLTKPSEILDFLNLEVKNSLQSIDEAFNVVDGMDLALCAFNKNSDSIEFAGAYNPLYIVRDKKIMEFEGDLIPIGEKLNNPSKKYTNHTIKLEKNDVLYLFSDGFPDQFGGPKRIKFFKRNFRKLLTGIHSFEMNKQKEELDEVFEEWKGDHEQIDDVIVIGIKIN